MIDKDDNMSIPKCPTCGREGWNEKCYFCKVECAECGMTIDGDSREGCPFCGSYEQNPEYKLENNKVVWLLG